MNKTALITLVMPPAELMALAQLAKRIDYDTVGRLSCRHTTYGQRTEHDVMWAAVSMLRGELATAGFAPR
jgi:hypothetical protein